MTTDRTSGLENNSSSPALRVFVITPNDTVPIPHITKAIRAPSDGVIALQDASGGAVVLHPVLAGERIDARLQLVRSTGTTVVGTIVGYA